MILSIYIIAWVSILTALFFTIKKAMAPQGEKRKHDTIIFTTVTIAAIGLIALLFLSS